MYRDWNDILNRAIIAIQDEEVDNWNRLARELGVPRRTLMDGMMREYEIEDVSQIEDLIMAVPVDDENPILKEYGNTAVLTSRSDRITSLEELLEAAKVDLDVWRVQRHDINMWEVASRSEKKSLSFSDGRIDGFVESDGELAARPLWQIKAWLVRINPIPVFPMLQPVHCLLSYEEPPLPKKEGILKTVIWSDPQVGFTKDLRNAKLTPFHDRRALDLLIQLVEYINPDRVDGLGDNLDLTMWTDKFARDPEFRFTTQPAICEFHYWMALLRTTVGPSVPIILHQGNHDVRIDNYTKLHIEEATGLKAVDELKMPPAMSIQKLLALDKLGIQWIGDYPDDEDWLNDNICLSHGDKAKVPGSTASTAVRQADYIQVVGHIHRSEMVVRKIHGRDGDKVVLCYCVPCLCHTDGRVPGSKKKDQWQKGLTVLEYEMDGKGYNFTSIPIQDDQIVYDGKLFTARDHLERIQLSFPDWNWA